MGVEFALLVDVAERFGIESVAQVDLGTIAHDSQTLHKLGPQAMAVLTVALRRAGYDRSITEVCDLVRFDALHRMDVESIPVGERPPMATLREYRARFFEELPA
jgi:glucosyl-3-phosphoglycerate synthase